MPKKIVTGKTELTYWSLQKFLEFCLANSFWSFSLEFGVLPVELELEFQLENSLEFLEFLFSELK